MPRFRRLLRTHLPLPLALLGLVAVIFLTGSAFLDRERRIRLAVGKERSQVESQLLAEQSAGVLREAEARLEMAALALPSGPDPEFGGPETFRRLGLQFRFVPAVVGLFLLDRQGLLRHSWSPEDLPAAQAESLLREHRDGLHAVLLSSLPAPTGRLVLSRRLERAGGGFRGVLGVTLDPQRFTDRYREYRSLDVDLIALYDAQATLLASWSGLQPEGEKQAARLQDLALLADIPLQRLLAGGQQALESPHAVLSTFQLPDNPLWIAVAYDRRGLLAALAPLVWAVYTGSAALSLTLIVSALWVRASAARRRRAELDLEASRAREEVLQVFRRVALVASEEEGLEGFLEKSLQEIRRFLGWPAVGLRLHLPGEAGQPSELRLWDGSAPQRTREAVAACEPAQAAWVPGPAGGGPDFGLSPGRALALIPLPGGYLPRGLFAFLAPAEAPGRAFLELLTQLASLVQRIAGQRLASREKERLEAQLEQSRRLEGLGTLAGGVAHDFNNMLAIILGNAEVAAAAGGAEESGAALARVRQTALRAGELSQRLLAVAGRALVLKRRLDLAELVRESEARLREEIAPGARLRLFLEPTPGEVEADPAQLRQVLLSLVRNASEALPEGKGDIEVACGNLSVDRSYLAACLGGQGLPTGSYRYLEVRDSGCGMDPGIVESLAEPFFSTKFLGRGLGLSASLGILRSHQGAMRISSRPGAGTTVTVLLPACA